MTAIEKTEAIKDLLETNLPPLLVSASLPAFDLYLNKSPKNVDDNELCVYIEAESNDENVRLFSVLIHAQLYGKDLADEYHSVIFPFLEENLKGSVVDMEQRIEIDADVWPIDINSSTAFIFYQVSFQTNLDDCE